MAEQCLANIIEGADPTDQEDVAIRKLLVAALSDSAIELAQMMNGRNPLLSACGRGTSWRVSVMRRTSRRRYPSLVAGRSYWH
jgi:hypothetical protein